MAARLTLDQIRDFWTRQAVEHGAAPSASWTDLPVIELEIREMLKHLHDGDRILDIGCANGYSTLHFAAEKKVTIRGLDFIPEMIEQANKRLADLSGQLAGTVSFDVGNILALKEPDASYDKLVVIRVVINLGDWSNQRQALRECARVLKPGGILLLSEATLQGWNQLNAFRREWALPDLPMPGFNNYLDQDRVLQETTADFEVVQVANFASTYYVGSRVLKPLLIQALGNSVDVANPHHLWNKWFAQLPAVGDFGTQKLFVLKRRPPARG